MTQRWVVEFDGVPTAREFTTTQGRGTPIVIDINTGRIYAYIGGAVTELAPASPSAGDLWTYAFLDADHTNNTTTTTIVPVMQLALPEAGTYEIEGRFLVQTVVTSTMPRLTAYDPDNCSGAWIITNSHASTTVLSATGGTSGTDGFTAGGTARVANGPMLAKFQAMYIASAASTVNLRIGLLSEVASSEVRMLAGSYLRRKKVA